MSETVYFIADLHLSESRPDITACFLSFLQLEAPQAKALYILGDLFEYWIGDDDKSDLTNTVASGIKDLSDKGTQVFFIHGNRDFLLGKRYAKRANMTLLPEVTTVELNNQPVVIMHGDTLCTRDVDYQIFRKKSRTWWWQTMIKSLPLFVRKKIAENYRKRSAESTAMKSQDIMDVTPEEVLNCFTENNSQLIIHGHTHRPADHQWQEGGHSYRRIVLGDWYEQGSWLKIDKTGFHLLNSPLNKLP